MSHLGKKLERISDILLPKSQFSYNNMIIIIAMDVYFETQRMRPFCIEVGYFDTVLEIKEKVHKYHGIPVSKQTLFFNGQLLQDDGDVSKSEILHNSRIQLVVATDKTTENLPSTLPPPPTNKIHLNVKTPSSKAHAIPLQMDVNDTVLGLKEKIHDTEGVPVNRLLLHHATGIELHDHLLLRDCDLSDNSEIDASLRPLPTASGAACGGDVGGGYASKKLKLMLLPKGGAKIPIEVNVSDNVGELRKELQRLHQRLQFHPPQEGFFFIYNQNVMEENKSFRWHRVGQGDTIEIFNGSITGGS